MKYVFVGVDPSTCVFRNLWLEPGTGSTREIANCEVLTEIESYEVQGWTIVALGRRVQKQLDYSGIHHLRMVHPAARGSIRARDAYHAHVADVLAGRIAA